MTGWKPHWGDQPVGPVGREATRTGARTGAKAAAIAMLVNPNDTWAETQITNTEAAARAVRQELIVLKAGTEDDIDTVFTTLVQRRAGALLVAASPLFGSTPQLNSHLPIKTHA